MLRFKDYSTCFFLVLRKLSIKGQSQECGIARGRGLGQSYMQNICRVRARARFAATARAGALARAVFKRM